MSKGKCIGIGLKMISAQNNFLYVSERIMIFEPFQMNVSACHLPVVREGGTCHLTADNGALHMVVVP